MCGCACACACVGVIVRVCVCVGDGVCVGLCSLETDRGVSHALTLKVSLFGLFIKNFLLRARNSKSFD